MNSQSASQKNELDMILADDLNRLSLNDRDKLYHEIHGVNTVLQETPELVKECIQALEGELARIVVKPAFDEATRFPNPYVDSERFRLMFLRAENYDPHKAAVRLVKFMDEKRRLFGPQTLNRNLLLSDLDADDLKCMKNGVFRRLSQRDRSGRSVWCSFQKLFDGRPYKQADNLMRCLWFSVMTSYENDDQSEKLGIVVLLYFIGDIPLDWDPEFQRKAPKSLDILPFKVNSVHFCCDSKLASFLEPMIGIPLSRNARLRFRAHTGSQTEIHFALMTFGIPIDVIPVTSSKKLKTGSSGKWMEKYQYRDELIRQTGNFTGIDLPASHDILLGRGKTLQSHSGNLKMRKVVQEHLAEYENVGKAQKTSISWKIVSDLKTSGARFVRRSDEGFWFVVSDEMAREKVSSCFRTVISQKTVKIQKTQHLDFEVNKRANAADASFSFEGNKRAKVGNCCSTLML